MAGYPPNPRLLVKSSFPAILGLALVASAGMAAQAAISSGPKTVNPSTPMSRVKSIDGATIAFERRGTGPALILVGGALSDRRGAAPLAERLAGNFTVYNFDRRGRGESTDGATYAVDREIEDIAALIDHAGGVAFLYGVSSGAALALQTAARLGPAQVPKLALYEPPYGSEDNKPRHAEQKRRVNELIKMGRPGEAASYFLTAIGTPPEALEKLKKSPPWEAMARMDFTLAYDYAILGDGAVPQAVAKAIQVPTLVLDGEKSLEFMRPTADEVARLIPGAARQTLSGQTHQAAPEVVAPVLIEFFGAAP